MTKPEAGVPSDIVVKFRRTSPEGKTLIKGFEDCKLGAYLDGGGVWTIGWGHTGPDVVKGLVWAQRQADHMFDDDILIRERQLNNLLKGAPTTQAQFDALMSLGYNIGMGDGGLKTSTLLRMHLAGEYAHAALQFPRWNKDNGKVIKGLTRRRKAEQALYSRKSA